MSEILQGDIGYVRGREHEGTKCIASGAALPAGIFPASPSAREGAKPSEVLGLTDRSTCRRDEWVYYGSVEGRAITRRLIGLGST